MTKIAFLDIDDVILTGRAHALPANIARLEAFRATDGVGLTLLESQPATFDPVAVAWLNRLAQLSGAKIVVHSSWRKSVGDRETVAHLISQGVEAAYLHEKPCCPWKFTSPKIHDISLWLDSAEERGEVIEQFVVIDDSDVWRSSESDEPSDLDDDGRPYSPMARHPQGLMVQVDPAVGFSPADYRKALDFFGVEDPLFDQSRTIRIERTLSRAEFSSYESNDRLVVLLIDNVPFTYIGGGMTECPTVPEVVVPQAEIDRLREDLPSWPERAWAPDFEDEKLVDRILAGDREALAELRRISKVRIW
ncbi:hypothetical protein CU669_16820 [Paramagnetospirillum kuznetsovii]|uniref:Uncharacterized protein n=1 Tax=Paramagnetospirillum kuznetsovii TaxID=2053833 RepID=A0A364NUK6_9PROT|nr:HAD domain-containing protein [Paramagnetospirillum kuznetsovii]RAU20746.1 hypothetical protein CU669_16820 [Paramagnetospirillum kuznetsovii]